MKVNALMEQLKEIKMEFPNLSNDEILKMMILKTLMEIRSKL